MEQFDIIKSLELELVSPDTRKDVARLRELLAHDSEEFASSGRVYIQAGCIGQSPGFKAHQLRTVRLQVHAAERRVRAG